MAIALATTTIAVERTPANAAADPYDPPADAVVLAANVRAHIGSPRGSEVQRGASSQVAITNVLGCDIAAAFDAADPPAIDPATDKVRDEATDELYEVAWADRRLGNGLDHIAAGLVRVRGVV